MTNPLIKPTHILAATRIAPFIPIAYARIPGFGGILVQSTMKGLISTTSGPEPRSTKRYKPSRA